MPAKKLLCSPKVVKSNANCAAHAHISTHGLSWLVDCSSIAKSDFAGSRGRKDEIVPLYLRRIPRPRPQGTLQPNRPWLDILLVCNMLTSQSLNFHGARFLKGIEQNYYARYVTRFWPKTQPVVDILQARKPTRVVVVLRKKSPFYAYAHDEVMQKTCTTIGVPHHETRKLLAIQKWQQLTVFIIDVFHDDYDASTAHHVTDLPVLLVDFGKRFASTRVASSTFQEQINVQVAKQHNYHGWDGKPPYFEDQTGTIPPIYDNPRDISMLWGEK